MEEFDFAIEHCPGVRHGNADALSRRPCSFRDCACHTAEQQLEDASSGFIGGSADYPRVLGPSVVQFITDDRRKSITNTDETARDVPSWSHDGLCAAPVSYTHLTLPTNREV